MSLHVYAVKDALEALLGTGNYLDSIIPADITISFICYLEDMSREAIRSVKSIQEIGEELGLRYEIIIATPEASAARIRPLNKIECVTIVPIEGRASGKGKRVGTQKSRSKYLVFFDPATAYPVSVADIIHSYIIMDTKKMLLSSFAMMPLRR